LPSQGRHDLHARRDGPSGEHYTGVRRRAAFFAAALFAALGPTLHLGAFATYDAPAVFLVALACWCVVRAGDRPDATVWMGVAGIVLALANATAYSTTLFDPVVIMVALLSAMPQPGGRLAANRALILLTVLVVLLAAGLLIGGSYYQTGVSQTTLNRAPGGTSAHRLRGRKSNRRGDAKLRNRLATRHGLHPSEIVVDASRKLDELR
jgi:hypothetical protein